MESSAVVMTCLSNGMGVIVIRGMSDLAGGQAGENTIGIFGPLAAQNTARAVLKLMSNLPTDGLAQLDEYPVTVTMNFADSVMPQSQPATIDIGVVTIPKPNAAVNNIELETVVKPQAAANNADLDSVKTAEGDVGLGDAPKPQVIYRCKKCRRIVASEESIVTHERGKGWEQRRKRSDDSADDKPAECPHIFVEPMQWMQTVQEGYVQQKLLCISCKARLGSFNWAGMQCSCGTWVNPAFQLQKSKLDECHI